MGTASRPARISARVEGTVQGVGFRPLRLPARGRARARRLRPQRRARRAARGRGRRRTRRAVPRARCAPRRRRWPGRARSTARDVEPRGRARLRDRAEPQRRGEPRRAGLARRRDLRRTASPSSSTPPTAATATRSSTAPTAGPRFTIVTRRPVRPAADDDGRRSRCATRCRAEYEDPRDRRFHAQPNACPECGPRCGCSTRRRGARARAGRRCRDAAAAAALRGGLIVAVKGLGGYHLACRADDEQAVVDAAAPQAPRGQAVRADGRRPRRAARDLVELEPGRGGAAARAAAPDRDRPPPARAPPSPAAVAPALARPRRDAAVHAAAPPAARRRRPSALVMTRGNVSDEPIAYRRRGRAARGSARSPTRFCVHDRPIHTRTDDSVVRAVDPRSARRRCCCAARAATCPREHARCRSRRPRRCSPAAPS